MNFREELKALLKRHAVEEVGAFDKDNPDLHSSLRDALTDLAHIARDEGEDWEDLYNGAMDVYNEECDELDEELA